MSYINPITCENAWLSLEDIIRLVASGGYLKTYGGIETIGESISFSPTDIAGLEVWIDANQGITLSGIDVTQWDNLADLLNPLVQAVPDLCPHFLSNQVNGLPVVDGDASNDIMACVTNIVCNTDFGLFAVIGGTASPGYMHGYSSTLYTRYLGTSTIWRNSTTHTFDHTNVTLGTGYYLHHMVRASGSVRSYRNYTESLTGALANALALTWNKIFSYGAAYGGASIAELLIYDATLTPQNLTDLKNYFAAKYAIVM